MKFSDSLSYRFRLFLFAASFYCCRTLNATTGDGGIYTELDAKTRFVYQIPPTKGALSGVLFVAHGCSHSGTDWWSKSESCPTCMGLPIEREIVKKAIESNMAIVALSSTNREHKCWVHRHDKMAAVNVIKFMYEKVKTPVGSKAPPLYLLGASSGGAFVGTLAQGLKLFDITASAICVQIMHVKIHRLNESMIPTLFVHMPLDMHTQTLIKITINEMNKHTPNSASEFQCHQKVLIPSFFFDHGAALTLKDSTTLVGALDNAGYLTPDKKLTHNPRESNWREVGIFLSSRGCHLMRYHFFLFFCLRIHYIMVIVMRDLFHLIS